MDLARQFASKSIYILKRKVGSGGSAEVFLYSRQTEGFPNQDVVLKVLKSADEETIRELLNEGSRLGSLRHPNILTTFGYEKIDEGTFGLVLEYFPGENLRALIPRFSSGERPHVAAHIVRVLCEALSLAHSQDIIHGDFGGRNVLVSQQGQIKLSDFGLACRSSSPRNEKFSFKGSADYLAPERWEGQRPSAEADIFSLGVLAYEILSGSHPLAEPSKLKGLTKVQSFLKKEDWRRFPSWQGFFEGTLCEKSLRRPAQELLKEIPFDKSSAVDVQRGIALYVQQDFHSDRTATQTHIFLDHRSRRLIKMILGVRFRGFGPLIFSLALTASTMTSLAIGQDHKMAAFFRPCVLTLTSRPWGELLIDGISQGYTPFINLPISPGFHVMTWRDSKGHLLKKSLMAYENSTLAFKIYSESGRLMAAPLPSFGTKKNF